MSWLNLTGWNSKADLVELDHISTSTYNICAYNICVGLTICLIILGLEIIFIERKTMENATLSYYKILKLVNMIDITIFQNLTLSAISSFVARLVWGNMF